VRRLVAAAVLVLLLITVYVGGWRLATLHRQYGVWAFTVGADSPRIQFRGRAYNRTQREVGGVPPGLVDSGAAPGNGRIYASDSKEVPTLIFVVYPGGAATSYTLSGGP
jgi:hypothetical protein